MRYFVAVVLPPLALLMCGRWFQAILNLILCIIGLMTVGIGWLLAIVHAFAVIANTNADNRHREMIGAINRT
jgi:uncharacterized membrane protein YqaE (UPF0057 family)